MLAEEMRILYVALTRAKEKLIITGIQKDYEKSRRDKELNLSIDSGEKKISPILVEKYKTYIDWIHLVYLKEVEKSKNLIKLNVIEKNKLIEDTKEDEEKELVDFDEKSKEFNNSENQEKIKKLLNWKYDFKGLEKVESATSVTKVKKLLNEEENTAEFKTQNIKPKFLSEDKGNIITAAQKGTLIHLCLKLMNEKEEYDENKIKELIEQLVLKDIITQKEADAIDKSILISYIQSELWNELKTAKSVCKEVPFYINLPANEVYNLEVKDNVLVQGIIDLYYISKDDELILVDYKTDFVRNEQELIKEYQNQLKIYKTALEQSLKKKVDKVYIYSLYLNKLLEIKE